MDVCKCGASFLDLEEDYARFSGYYKPLEIYDYNFFDEILLCMSEQGFKPFIIIDKKYIDLTTVYLIRELEDEIMESLK